MKKISLSAYYSTDLAKLYADEFESENHILKVYSDHELDTIVLFQNQKLKDESYFKKSKLARLKKEQLQDIATDVIDFEIDRYSKSELIDLLLNVSNEEYYKEVSYVNSNECDFAVSGYCSRDYFKVKLIGSKNFKENYDREFFTKLYYDCPAVIDLTVESLNEKESNLLSWKFDTVLHIDLTEYLDDIYNYNKTELIENFTKNYNDDYKNEIIQYLTENLRDVLNYD